MSAATKSRVNTANTDRGNPSSAKQVTFWSSDCNSENLLSNTDFNADLSRDTKSKGSCHNDYTAICNSYKIFPCPFVKFNINENDSVTLRVTNCEVDRCSLRAALLASAIFGSKVSEMIFRNCKFTPQHFADVAAVLSKLLYMTSVRFEFMTLDTAFETVEYAETIKLIISSDTYVDYLSFRGCKLGDQMISSIASALSTNFSIKLINLNDNKISDASTNILINALRTNCGLEGISLTKNAISGSFLINLFNVITGDIASADDVVTMKSIIKKSIDKLKKIKDMNRKRKKANMIDLPEWEAIDHISKAADGSNAIVNKQVKMVDISSNPINQKNLEYLKGKFSDDKYIYAKPENGSFTIRMKNVEDISLEDIHECVTLVRL